MVFAMLVSYSQVAMPSLDTTPQELKELEILMMQSSKLEFCPFPGLISG